MLLKTLLFFVAVISLVNPNDIQGIDDQQSFSYFDIELAQKLSEQEKNNWVTSPASVKTTLGLILEGSNGVTQTELSHIMRLPFNKTLAQNKLRKFQQDIQKPSKTALLKFSSRVLIKKGVPITNGYKTTIHDNYNAIAEQADFSNGHALSEELNTWVSKVTDGLIPTLIDPSSISPDSSLVLVNAIYFNGQWKVSFNPKANKLGCFYSDEANTCKKVEFMTTSGYFRIGVVKPLNALVLELPYNDPRYSMVFLLPTDGIQQMIRDLPFNPLLPIIESLPFSEAIVVIPKFTIDYTVKLKSTLEKLGAKEMFTDKSDLSSMIQGNGKVTEIVHKAKISVNEKGTLAGAGTAAFVETLIASAAVEFKANRPFLFFIRDTSSGFLFEGQFSSPQEEPPSNLKGFTPGNVQTMSYPPTLSVRNKGRQ